ncbi:MAG: hypothetical protein HKN87_04130 [Saprospiraceae bacterium]|nr:hypothetical protein [Saprospiraceae bacterium]
MRTIRAYCFGFGTMTVLVFALFLAGCEPQGASRDQSESKASVQMETLVSDGAWCWFSDPRAIYHHGADPQIYFGYINQQGDVCIGAQDVATRELTTYILHDSLEIDDHNVPTVLILPSDHLLTFYNEHNGHVFMRRSARPADINAWEPERIIARASDQYNYTYTNPLRLSNEEGRIYLFGRKVGPTRSFAHWWPYFIFSDDDGESWSEDMILLDNEGRENPPYMKVATDHKGRIDFLFTDGHPKIGSDVSVYHMFYLDGAFHQTNGDRIAALEELPIAIAEVEKIYDAASSDVRAWIWDIALDKADRPVVTYARYPTENDHRYHYAYWDGHRWQDEEVCRAGGWMPSLRQGDVVREAHYSGGIVLDPQDPTSVYLSRQIEGKFEIQHLRRISPGEWSHQSITEASEENNVRPYVVYDRPDDYPSVLWMSGIYNHYTRYETGIKIAY